MLLKVIRGVNECVMIDYKTALTERNSAVYIEIFGVTTSNSNIKLGELTECKCKEAVNRHFRLHKAIDSQNDRSIEVVSNILINLEGFVPTRAFKGSKYYRDVRA